MITYNQLNIHHVFLVADMNVENSVYDQKRVTCNQTADKIDPKYFIADRQLKHYWMNIGSGLFLYAMKVRNNIYCKSKWQ